MFSSPGARDDLKVELAAAAARLIAEDGCDYATAKRKAAELVLGSARPPRGSLPENELIESELRRYFATFDGDRHVTRLADLRRIALTLMERLERFNPHLTGAVLNATAGEHSDLYLLLYVDSAKDVEVELINEGIEFEVDDGDEDALELIRFLLPRQFPAARRAPLGVVLRVLPTDAIRIAARGRSNDPALSQIESGGRAGIAALRTLLGEAP